MNKNNKPLFVLPILFFMLLSSCAPFFQPIMPGEQPPDENPPGDVKNLSAVAYAVADMGVIKLEWNDPTNIDLDHIEIICVAGEYTNETDTSGLEVITILPDTREYVFKDVKPDIVYTIIVKTVDAVGNKSGGVTVSKMLMPFFYNIPAMKNYLDSKAVNTAAAPYGAQLMDIDLSEDGTMGTMNDFFAALSRYVYIDLSHCTNIQDWDRYTNAGCEKIVYLILPDSAKTIVSGTSLTESTFGTYTNVKMIEAASIHTVGAYSFANCSSVQQVNMPSLQIIQVGAFSNCTSITIMDLPNVRTIYAGAFYACNALKIVKTKYLTNIYDGVFSYCDSISYIYFGKNPPTITGAALFQGVPYKTVKLSCSIVYKPIFQPWLEANAASFIGIEPQLSFE